MAEQHLQPALDRHGETVTITNYDKTGEDSYNDPVVSETDITTTAIVEKPGSFSQTDRTARTETAPAAMNIYVGPDVTVHGAERTAPRASTITRANNDDAEYRVISVITEGSGLQRCEAQRTEERTGV